jgi:hypothetical protein
MDGMTPVCCSTSLVMRWISYGIVHLEHHVESQDVELEERAVMIADHEQ